MVRLMALAIHKRGKSTRYPLNRRTGGFKSRSGSSGGKSLVNVRNRTTIHRFAVRTQGTKWLCVTSFFCFLTSFHVKLYVFRGCRTKPAGESKERLMQLSNKEYKQNYHQFHCLLYMNTLFLYSESFVCSYDVALFHNQFDFYVMCL